MIDRRWLSQLGPFRASEPIAKVDDTAEQLRDELKDALETIDNLSGRLEASDEELSKAHDDIQFLLEHIDTMEKAGD
jgi:septal ring factor EnvC (AmiA/AmiB activator)